MKKIVLSFALISSFIQAKECYQTYNYSDNHQVVTVMKNKIANKVSQEDIKIDARLHTRSIENNGSKYTLFWLENGVLDKDKIDKNSIYSPFLIKNNNSANKFLIESLRSLTKNNKLNNQLKGIIDLLQYSDKDGIYRVTNSMGKVDINQTSKSNLYTIKHLKQYEQNKENNNVKYINSIINLTLDNNCSRWSSIKSRQKIKFSTSILDTTVVSDREFLLSKSSKKLDKDHWFYQLSADVSKWGFKNKKNNLTKPDALSMFGKKEQEMKALLEDSKKFEKWVRDNMEFLKYLSSMLESQELDDEVSKTLFSYLGFIDSYESTEILADVTLNENILEKERFRGMVALKDTTAPLDENLIDEIVDYGLSSQNGNDFIKNATGMIVGALARERIDSSPEQYEYLTDSIIDTIETSQNKTVSLTAAGNMLESAPDRLVKTVDNMLASSENHAIRRDSAHALLRIKKSTLEVSDFEVLLKNETDIDALAEIIKASASAKDFNTNTSYKSSLTAIANNKSKVNSNRIAALETLKKAGFGQNDDDKKLIRKMMLGEQDSDISQLLKKLYRQ